MFVSPLSLLFLSFFIVIQSFPILKIKPFLSDISLRLQLKNKKIIFIGDSVTRYQYLNLIFFLERKSFLTSFFNDTNLPGSPCC